MTLQDALRSAVSLLESHHIEDARLDAELLLAEARRISRAALLAHLDDSLDDATLNRFDDFIARRAQHEPVAYILGHKEFYGLHLLVDRRVLIPRPETELLVECAVEWVKQHRPSPRRFTNVAPLPTGERGVMEARTPSPSQGEGWGEGGFTIIDVGTGSGALAIAIAASLTPTPALPRLQKAQTGEGAKFPPLRSGGGLGWGYSMLATDLSPDALAVARANAERLGVGDYIQFVQSDLLAGVDARADLIVANLPYIARDEWRDLAPDIADYEPRLALDDGDDGLVVFRAFFAQAPSHLAPNGAIMLEIGATQAQAVSALARAAFPHATIDVKKDLAGLDRVVVIQS